jgi:hypothetical protein
MIRSDAPGDGFADRWRRAVAALCPVGVLAAVAGLRRPPEEITRAIGDRPPRRP